MPKGRKPLLGEVALRRYRTFYIVLGYFDGSDRSFLEHKLQDAGYGRGEIKDYLVDLEHKGLIVFRDGNFSFTEKGEQLHAGGLFKAEVLGGDYRLE